MSVEFTDLITSEDELREVLGHPAERNVRKVIPVLDDHCRDFISRSPFMLLASTDSEGAVDVSPKGDPPGFVNGPGPPWVLGSADLCFRPWLTTSYGSNGAPASRRHVGVRPAPRRHARNRGDR